MLQSEKKRLLGLKRLEAEARLQGYSLVVGIDEAGRGPLAGPVMAAVCFIPEDIFIPGVKDSKVLTSTKRALIFEQIRNEPRILYAVGSASHEEIDQINIYQATKLAMKRALETFPGPSPDFLLIDGLSLPEIALPQQKIIKGDALSYSIAAASIIAKETRDAHMCALDKEWPMYGFAAHKGYGTKAHREALLLHGPCAFHRKSFLKSFL